jgi:hypothetical protein
MKRRAIHALTPRYGRKPSSMHPRDFCIGDFRHHAIWDWKVVSSVTVEVRYIRRAI